MRRINALLTPMTACLLLTLALSAQAADKKIDPAGTWTWSAPGRDGNTREVTLKLKLDGEKLTGTISGRQNDSPIEDAKISGDDISFKVVREFNGNKMVQQFRRQTQRRQHQGKERDGAQR